MKKFSIYSLFLLFLFSLQSCELIGDIFKAGMWAGILIVVVVIGLIIWLFSKIL